jgi:hypothetical protein
MAARMKIIVFWDVAPSSLAETDRRFRGTYCLPLIALMMEAARTSETLVAILLRDYTALQPRRQPSSYLPP